MQCLWKNESCMSKLLIFIGDLMGGLFNFAVVGKRVIKWTNNSFSSKEAIKGIELEIDKEKAMCCLCRTFEYVTWIPRIKI